MLDQFTANYIVLFVDRPLARTSDHCLEIDFPVILPSGGDSVGEGRTDQSSELEQGSTGEVYSGDHHRRPRLLVHGFRQLRQGLQPSARYPLRVCRCCLYPADANILNQGEGALSSSS